MGGPRKTKGGHGSKSALCNSPRIVHLRGNIYRCEVCKEFFEVLLKNKRAGKAGTIVQVAAKPHWPEYKETRRDAKS